MNTKHRNAEDSSSSSQSFPLPNRGSSTQKVILTSRPRQQFSFDEDDSHSGPTPDAANPPKTTKSETSISGVTPLPTNEDIAAAMAQADHLGLRPGPALAKVSAPSAAERDPNMISVELPSKFFFYPFKELSIGNVRIRHQAKFARAAAEESTQITCEAVSSLLGEGVSALDLTIPDFFWVLYWLRLNSFSKSPLNYRAVCYDKDHLAKVDSGELPAESLITVDIVNKSSIKETFLDVEGLTKFLNTVDMEELTKSGYTLTAPTMRDTIELEDKWLGKEGFAEQEYLADLASCVRRLDGSRVSLQERMDFVGDLRPDTATALAEFRDFVQSYGVEEKVATRCKECGAVVETEVSITAYDFL